MKILFQGDSITDCGRDKRNYHDLGPGYPKYAAELISTAYPETDFEFINFGIGGNRTSELFDRLYEDGIAFQPDIISIFIGINDIWHRYGVQKIATTYAQIKLNYRSILERIKRETSAKIIMIQPYLLDAESINYLREDHVELMAIVKELADEFADAYIPLHEYFTEAMKTQPEPCYYSADGVHPNEIGAKLIAGYYKSAVDKLMK